MEINTTQISPNYTSELKSESSAKVNDVFENMINENGYLAMDLEESELRDLSYEEAKELKSKLEENGYFDEIHNDTLGLTTIGNSLLKVTELTNDDDFNKALFETMQTKEHPGLYFDEIKHNIEYSEGRRKHPYPTIDVSEVQGLGNVNYTYSPMTNEEFKNINIKEFLEDIIQTYQEMLLKLPGYLDREETEETLNSYKELQKSYQEKKDEKNVLLENLTKNNKENPLLNIE